MEVNNYMKILLVKKRKKETNSVNCVCGGVCTHGCVAGWLAGFAS